MRGRALPEPAPVVDIVASSGSRSTSRTPAASTGSHPLGRGALGPGPQVVRLAILEPVHEPQRLPALVDRAGLVVHEAVGEPDLLHHLEVEIARDLGGLLRPGDPEPSAGSSAPLSSSKRCSRSARVVVKKTTTPAPGFAPSFRASGVPSSPIGHAISRGARTRAPGRGRPSPSSPPARASREPCPRAAGTVAPGDSAGYVHAVGVRHLRAGEPERHLHPLADLVLEEELLRDPGDLGPDRATSRQASRSSPQPTPSFVALNVPARPRSHA